MVRKTSILAAVGLAVVFTIAAAGGTQPSGRQSLNHWEGYLIDLSCALERKDKEPDLGPKHSKKCLTMPACDRSGFGLLSDHNELWRFDEEGNQKVRALILKTKRDVKLRIFVRGAISGEIITIRNVEFR